MRGLLSLLLLLAVTFFIMPATAQKPSKKFKRKLDAALEKAASNDCDAIAEAAALLLVNSNENYGLRDEKAALNWLRKGYELNCPRATCDFATAILHDSEGKAFDSAINVLARSAAMGYVEADYQMGLRYLYGVGSYSMSSGIGPESNTRPYFNMGLAAQCFKRAVAKGHTDAAKQLELIQLVADKPLQKALEAYNIHDYATALKYFHYAAIGKDPVAMLYLGHMHLYGQGVKQDNFHPTQTFYRQAGFNGLTIGFYMSGRLEEQFDKDIKWVKYFYQMGADHGSQECIDALARINRQQTEDYNGWKSNMLGRVNTEAGALSKKATGQQTCTMCRGAGKIESPIQQNLYQDKNGRWYHLRGTQYEACWMCHGSGKM